MDWTPLIHAALALAAQLLGGLLLGDWILGGVLACTWWLAREHAQAEHRWIQYFGAGKRASMPWWGGFDRRAWDVPGLLDAAIPIAACAALYLLTRFCGFFNA